MAKPASGSHSGLMYGLADAKTQRKSKKYTKQLLNKSNRRMIKEDLSWVLEDMDEDDRLDIEDEEDDNILYTYEMEDDSLI